MSSRGITLLGLAVIVCVVAGSAAGRMVAAPTIASIAPASAYPGQTVTISGRNLTGARVYFKGIRSLRVTVNATGRKLTAAVPAGVAVGRAKVTVRTNGGTVTAANFKVLAIP